MMTKTPLRAALLTLLATPVVATTIVSMPDADLVDRSPVIVEAVVEALAPAGGAGFPATDVTARVERSLKGSLGRGETLVVRQLGGRRADGLVLHAAGVARLVPGGRYLLFLRGGERYRLVDPVLGAFRDVTAEGRRLAWRDLSGVHILDGGGERLRAFEPFAAWVGERARGHRRAAEYFVADQGGSLRRSLEGATLGGEYSLFTDTQCSGAGLHIRHFSFDDGGSFTQRALASGQPGLSGGGFSEFQTAIGAWNADAATPIKYVYGGTTASEEDCNDSIVFGDPDDAIDGSFSGSGTVAVGGVCYDCDVKDSFNGDQYFETLATYIITQDGIEEIFSSQGSLKAQELFAHELGHTLGLGHSNSSSALMFPTLHNPPIGATLSSDERAAIEFLYADDDPPANSPPDAPSSLIASALSSTSILLTWSDNSSNETSFRVEEDSTDDGVDDFVEVAQLSAGADSFERAGLGVATKHRFRVRAHNANGFSPYSNVAPAVTLDESTPPPPAGEWLETAELPGFRFKVRITNLDVVRDGTEVADCEPETLCVAGAKPNRAEAYLRVIGPRPNGFLWNQVIRFTVSQVEAWFEQLSTGTIKYYSLPGVDPDSAELDGISDREGFLP